MTVRSEFSGSVCTLTLDRAERRNAIDTASLQQLEDLFQQLRREPAIDIVCVRAEGSVFCAGTDLKELAQMDEADLLHWQTRAQALVQAWQQLDATTVCVLPGPAMGSGAVLAMASDVRLGVEGAWLQFPELRHGLPLTWHGVAVLCSTLGIERTRRALLFAERLELATLRSWGCWDVVVATEGLTAALEDSIGQLQQASPLARRMTKRALLSWHQRTASHEAYLATYAASRQGFLRSNVP